MENLYKYLKDVPTINPNVAVSLAIADASDDTEDATAVAADIKEGKTAYIATGKVTGTFKGVDTSDGDAIASDIANGKVAYANGVRVTGSLNEDNGAWTQQAESVSVDGNGFLMFKEVPVTKEMEFIAREGYTKTVWANSENVAPVIGLTGDKLVSGNTVLGVEGTHTCPPGLDTSDATATEDQILSGKTAYVNGEKVTGTLSFGTTLTHQGNLSVSDDNVVTAMTVLDSNFCIYSDGSVPKQARLTLTASQVAESIGLTADKLVTGNTILDIAGTATTGVDTSDANATAADILTGKTAYVNGSKITGSIPNVEAATITPGILDQTINAGQYMAGAQTIKGEPNLLAENIKNGVSIFGVSGTYSGTPTTVTAVHQGKVKDTSNITLQTDYRTSIMKNNFEFDDGYVLAEGDAIMFPDNVWVSAVVSVDVSICNHSSTNAYELKGKTCYVLSKAEAMA